MFNHEWIEAYAFEDIPLDRDICLMEERWLTEYEAALMAFLRKETKEFNVGEVAFVAARRLAGDIMHLSWYPNIYDRHHEVRVRLPRSAFVAAISSLQIDEKPRVFVKNNWLQDLYTRSYSIFTMIDAIGVKSALFGGQITEAKLLELQRGVDAVAAIDPEMIFVSFADSLLIKINWLPMVKSDQVYAPEKLPVLLEDIQALFRCVLSLDTYAVIAQGSNEYRDLVHRSVSGNHLSLNSLGLPFAQITAIDQAARQAIKAGRHVPAEVYMDEDFFRSLRLRYGFAKADLVRAPYTAPLSAGFAHYVMSSRKVLIENLDPMVYMNANMPRQSRQQGRPTLEMHPADAERLGLADGAEVLAYNARGSVAAALSVTDAIVEGTVVFEGKWWWTRPEEGAPVSNRLAAPQWTAGGQPCYNDIFVEVAKGE